MSATLSIALEGLLPERLEAYFDRTLASAMPRRGEGNRYAVAAAGRFRGALTADLLSFARSRGFHGALLLDDGEVCRILYFRAGTLIGADTNVFFERVGRILLREGVVGREDAETLVAIEEEDGVGAVVERLPRDVVAWALERRTWEVGTALYFMPSGHFVFVEGMPNLGAVPAMSIAPMHLAMEGLRLYDEWRNGRTDGTPDPPARPAERSPEEEADRIIELLRRQLAVEGRPA